MTVVTTLTLGILAVAAALCLRRLVVGVSLPDRVVALDTILVILSAGIAVAAAGSGETAFLDAMVVVALVAFVGTSTVARFIEQRGAR